ncbi:MAG: amidohydrolase family protein [Lachnospiraceae bacterium]
MNWIIDIHTHIYPVALARRAMEVTGHENDDFKKLPIRENLLARMREAGVDLSVNLPVVSKPQNQGEVNRFAKEAARKNIISFGGLHPDCENVIEELEKLKDMEMAGIKFHPPFQKVHLEDPKYEEMWRKINELGFPVLIHMGTARIVRPYDLYPSGIRKILKFAPDIPIIMAHMGSFCMMKNPDEDLENLPENVFIDTAMSAELEEAGEFEEIIRRFGTNRVLYGSDFPYGTQKAAIARIKDSSFTDSEKEDMLWKNAAKILKAVGKLPENIEL